MAMMNGMDYGMADRTPAGGFRVAIYCRLSKDDDLQGESASIANQRDMLEKYCKRQGWEVVSVYQDDGYTGLNMERPDLKRMLKAVERRQVNLVITKDLSRLEENKIPCPTWWNRNRGLRNVRTKWEKKDPVNGQFMWDFSVIKELLMNPVYTGAIASQKAHYKFKIGTIGDKKSEEWIVVEGQHEAIIDRESFNIVQKKLKSRQRPGKSGEISLFAGLVKCGECGKALCIRTTHEKFPKRIYSCKTYNAFGKTHCTQHRVEYDTLYALVLNKIRECAKMVLVDGEAVAGKLSGTCEAEQKGQKEALERSLAKAEERINILEKMVLRLYEGIAAGRINEQNFNLMLEKTQKEQKELQAKISEGKKKLADEIQLVNNARQWITAIQEYADIAELDAAILNKLVKEIVVHEEIDSDKTRHISIEIHFNLKPIPEVEQVRK